MVKKLIKRKKIDTKHVLDKALILVNKEIDYISNQLDVRNYGMTIHVRLCDLFNSLVKLRKLEISEKEFKKIYKINKSRIATEKLRDECKKISSLKEDELDNLINEKLRLVK